jgi:predicted PurR-regulated permease PerM
MTDRPIRLVPKVAAPPAPFERLLNNASRISLLVLAAVALTAVAVIAQALLAPIVLAIVIGLMFGPLADMLEWRGIRPSVSAGVVVLAFVGAIVLSVFLFVGPMSEWVGRGPQIWQKLQGHLAQLQAPLAALGSIQEQVQGATGSRAAMAVSIKDGSALMSWAFAAPAMAGELLVFLASLYFYLATRHVSRRAVLSVVTNRALRWRLAHVYREIEHKISSFLVTVTMLNLAVGVAVAASMQVVGLPSPVLWGALAFVLNYIPYIGQGIMMLLLLLVGAGTKDGLVEALLPVGCYMVINFAEGQVITPHLLGHRMTLNPFLIFLSTAFGIWIWGPIGGAIAVPMLLVSQVVMVHVLPRSDRTLRVVEKKLAAALSHRNASEEEP